MKKYGHIAFGIIFVMSLSNCVFSREDHNQKDDKKDTTKAQSPFKEVDNFIQEFDNWDSGDFFEKVEQEVNNVARKLKETIQHIRHEGPALARKALEQTSNLMRSGATKIDELKTHMDEDTQKREQAKNYDLHEYTDEKKNVYGIKIALPNIKKDDITVNITENKKRHGIAKSLKVTAQEKNQTEGISQRFSRRMYSRSTVKGKTKETAYTIIYDNGNVTISTVLPDTIDTKKYTMAFDSETLTIEFEQEKEDKAAQQMLQFTQ